MGTKHIVKVQRPLAQSGGEPIWLVYSEGRTGMQEIRQIDIPAKVRSLMGHKAKAYFNAYRRSTGWEILPELVEDQPW